MQDGKSTLAFIESILAIDWSKKRSIVIGTVDNVIGVGLLGTILALLGAKIPFRHYLYLMIIVEVVVILVWVYYRFIKSRDTKTVSVGFAIRTDNLSESIYTKLKSEFEDALNQNGLTDIVKVLSLPSDLSFKKDSEAEKYLNKNGLRVLIWGNVTSNTAKGEMLSTFKVRTSYQYDKPKNFEGTNDIVATIEQGTKRSAWTVKHSDTLLDIEVIGSNILDISLLTLGVCLVSVRQVNYVEHGVKVLENVKTMLAARNQDFNFPNINDVKNHVDIILLTQYRSLSEYYLLTKKDKKTSYTWSMKAVNFAPNDYMANIQAARLSWETGNYQKAREYTNKASSVSTTAECLHKLNFGFFNLNDGKYGSALKQYQSTTLRGISSTNMIEVIEFIQQEYDKTSKPALLFGAGWLSIKFGDKTLGHELLRNFMSLAGNSQEYKPLIKETNKILSKQK